MLLDALWCREGLLGRDGAAGRGRVIHQSSWIIPKMTKNFWSPKFLKNQKSARLSLLTLFASIFMLYIPTASTSMKSGASLCTTRPHLVMPSKARLREQKKAYWIANCVQGMDKMSTPVDTSGPASEMPVWLKEARGAQHCKYGDKCRRGIGCFFYHNGNVLKDYSIFVKNLPGDTSDAQIWRIAARFGEVTRVCMLDSKYDDTRSVHVHFTREHCGLKFLDFMQLTPFHGNILRCMVKTNQTYCVPIDKEIVETMTINVNDKKEYPSVIKKIVRFNLANTLNDIESAEDVLAWKAVSSDIHTAAAKDVSNTLGKFKNDFDSWKEKMFGSNIENIETVPPLKVLTPLNNTDFIALSDKKRGKMKMSDVDCEWKNIADSLDNDNDKTYAQIVNPLPSSPSPVSIMDSTKNKKKAWIFINSEIDEDEDTDEVDKIIEKRYEEEFFNDYLFALRYMKTTKMTA
jgi:RNA recognition motif-containing protein